MSSKSGRLRRYGYCLHFLCHMPPNWNEDQFTTTTTWFWFLLVWLSSASAVVYSFVACVHACLSDKIVKRRTGKNINISLYPDDLSSPFKIDDEAVYLKLCNKNEPCENCNTHSARYSCFVYERTKNILVKQLFTFLSRWFFMLVCFMEIMDSERSEMRTHCSNCKQINTKILGDHAQ